MPENLLAYWLWIVMVMGIAYKETAFLTEKFPDIREMYQQMLDPDCTFMKDNQKKRASQISLGKAEAILEECDKQQISMMTWNSEDYPEGLRNIYNPPAVLFYKGNPVFLRNENLLTAVGTRHPSEHSYSTAEKLYAELVDSGYTLVSGCAVGLDTAAHRAAVTSGKPTIAVLGCGIDRNYPSGSRELKERITQNGLLLTEFFPGTPPYSSNFPIRNRILIGISQALLVTEAGINSGCLVTANIACEQGKPVFCIPPSDIYAGRYAGQIKLLRDGAFSVYGAEEIIQEMSRHRTEKSSVEKKIEIKNDQEDDRSIPEQPASPPETELNEEYASLLPEEQAIIQTLSEGQKNVNMLCCMTGMNFETLSLHLLELEIMGWIININRDFYQLTEKYHGKASA